jgi:hypothetical protein
MIFRDVSLGITPRQMPKGSSGSFLRDFLYQSHQSLGSFTPLFQGGIIRFDHAQGFLGTHFHALWRSTAEIALDHAPFIPVYDGNPKGTDEKTGAASDAEICIHDNGGCFHIPRNRLARAYFHAERFFALLTGHGDESADIFHPERTDACEGKIELVVMFERTRQGTRSATDAFFRVGEDKFVHSMVSLLHVTLRTLGKYKQYPSLHSRGTILIFRWSIGTFPLRVKGEE